MNEQVWDIVLKRDYFTIIEQFSLRMVCTKFNKLLALRLRDADVKKQISKDCEARALVRMSVFPSILRIVGPELTSKPLLPLLTSNRLVVFKMQGCPVDKINDSTLAQLGATALQELEIDCRAVFLGSRNGYNGSRQTTVTDAAFKPLVKAGGLQQLKYLTLIWVRSFTGDGLADLCLASTQLEKAKLWWANCTERVMLALSLRENLVELDLRTCKETAASAAASAAAAAAAAAATTGDAATAAAATEEIGLKRIFTRCTKLTKLCLVDVSSCNDSALGELGLGYIKHLTHLFLSDLDVSNAGLETLCLHIAPGLTHLHLSHFKSVTNTGLAKLICACEKLEHLELSWIPGITDEALVEIAKRPPPTLRSVKLDGLKDLSNVGLIALVKSTPRLGYLLCLNSKCTSAQALNDHNKQLRVKLAAW